jgi:hypothetical protein
VNHLDNDIFKVEKVIITVVVMLVSLLRERLCHGHFHDMADGHGDVSVMPLKRQRPRSRSTAMERVIITFTVQSRLASYCHVTTPRRCFHCMLLIIV